MELLTVSEVADKLKVNDESIYRWLQSGKLKGMKLGEKLWRISQENLDEFIKDGQDK